MKQHEAYMISVAQMARSKSEFIVAGLNAKIDMEKLASSADTMFALPPPPSPFNHQ